MRLSIKHIDLFGGGTKNRTQNNDIWLDLGISPKAPFFSRVSITDFTLRSAAGTPR